MNQNLHHVRLCKNVSTSGGPSPQLIPPEFFRQQSLYGMARNGTNDELYSPVNLLELVQNEEGGGEWAVGQQSFSARENDADHT